MTHDPTTKSSPLPSSSQPTAATRKFAPLAIAFVLLAAIFGFLNLPIVPNAELQPPRWALIIEATTNPGFAKEIWFGADLPTEPRAWERCAAFGLGALAFLAAFFVGRAIFEPFRRRFDQSRLSRFGAFCETAFFSGILGVAVLACAVLLLGLLGKANSLLAPECAVLVVLGFAFYGARLRRSRRGADPQACEQTHDARENFDKIVDVCSVLALLLFASFYLFSATQPLFEYDALEYHAQGAREIFESGSIRFSTNNAYLNMPLGAETLYVVGLDLARDVGYSGQDVLRVGLLVGKTMLTLANLLTVLGLLAFGERAFGSRRVGVWSALLFLSFPNFFEVNVNGLNDAALSLATLAAFYILWATARGDLTKRDSPFVTAVLLGVVCGFAISVKYTGVVFIFAPTFIAFICVLIFRARQARRATQDVEVDARRGGSPIRIAIASLLLLVVAGALAGGWGWKNYQTSGNPVYPLGWSVFGDSSGTWNASIDERWKRAHSSRDFSVDASVDVVKRVFLREEYASPFYLLAPCVFLFAVAALLRRNSISPPLRVWARSALPLCAFCLLFWLAWFYATHRLSRFLIPIAPIVASILGSFFAHTLTSRSKPLKYAAFIALVFGLTYSGLMIDVLGQGRMASLRALERDPMRFSPASIYVNDHPEVLADGKLLLVGDAKACAFRVPVLYSTCWNDSPLVEILGDGVERDANGRVVKILDPKGIVNRFRERDVALVYVDFFEIARFRSAGNYGFNNDEIDENLFLLLIESNVLEPFDPKDAKPRVVDGQFFKPLRE